MTKQICRYPLLRAEQATAHRDWCFSVDRFGSPLFLPLLLFLSSTGISRTVKIWICSTQMMNLPHLFVTVVVVVVVSVSEHIGHLVCGGRAISIRQRGKPLFRSARCFVISSCHHFLLAPNMSNSMTIGNRPQLEHQRNCQFSRNVSLDSQRDGKQQLDKQGVTREFWLCALHTSEARRSNCVKYSCLSKNTQELSTKTGRSDIALGLIKL